MKTFTKIVLALGLLLNIAAVAHEDTLGKITGEKMELFYLDHAISGQINEQLVWALPLDREFGIRLTHYTKGIAQEAVFKKEGTAFTGKVGDTVLTITRASAEKGLIEGTLGKDAFTIKISATAMEGNHYVNPTFDVSLPDKTYTFKLQDGQACLGCATKIGFVVLGMLRSSGAL